MWSLCGPLPIVQPGELLAVVHATPHGRSKKFRIDGASKETGAELARSCMELVKPVRKLTVVTGKIQKLA